jgi:hypothetical protein
MEVDRISCIELRELAFTEKGQTSAGGLGEERDRP